MRNRNQFLGKLRLFIIILVTVPVLVVSIFSYFRSSAEIKKRVVEANVNVMLQTQTNIEQTLRIIDSMVVSFLRSPVFTTAMEQELATFNIQAYSQLFEGLHSLQRYQLPVQNVYMIHLENKWAIDNRGAFEFSDVPGNKQIAEYIKAPDSYFWTYEENRGEPEAGVDGYQAINGISLVAKVPIKSPDPKGLLIVQISRESLIETVVKSTPVKGLIILDEKYRTIYSEDASMIGKDISFLPYVSAIDRSAESRGYFETEINGKSAGVSYGRSNYNNWHYISLVPIDEINKDTRSAGIYTLLISLFILFVTWISTLKMTGNMYNPIRKLIDAIRSRDGNDEISRENKDELQWIYDRFDSMSQMNVQMSHQLKNQLRYIREYYVIRLLKGQILSHELEEHGRLFPHSPSWKWTSVLSIEIDTFAGNVYKNSDNNLMVFSVFNVVNDIISTENQLCSVIMDETVLIVIGSSQHSLPMFKSFRVTLGNQIHDTLKDILKIRVSIGISDAYQGLTNIHQAFQESREALKYRIRYEEEALISIEEVRSEKTFNFTASTQLENELIHAVKFESKDTVERCVKQLVREIRSPDLAYIEYEFYLFRLVVTLFNLVPDPGTVFPAIFAARASLLDQIKQLKTVEDIEHWLMDKILCPLVEQFEASRGTHQKRLASKMVHMIESAIDSDLTIELCAVRLSYSPNYLRRIFLEETGINFGEYVIRYRVDEAKRLLVESDMKIADIADKLKYSNSQNFIRQFRKWEGVTPGEYREKSNGK
jgi:two-component system response regulator YesN